MRIGRIKKRLCEIETSSTINVTLKVVGH